MRSRTYCTPRTIKDGWEHHFKVGFKVPFPHNHQPAKHSKYTALVCLHSKLILQQCCSIISALVGEIMHTALPLDSCASHAVSRLLACLFSASLQGPGRIEPCIATRRGQEEVQTSAVQARQYLCHRQIMMQQGAVVVEIGAETSIAQLVNMMPSPAVRNHTAPHLFDSAAACVSTSPVAANTSERTLSSRSLNRDTSRADKPHKIKRDVNKNTKNTPNIC